MHKIILVERYTPSSFYWTNLIKNKKNLELSVEQVLDKYQGFEGELIDFFHVKKSEDELNHIIKSLIKTKTSSRRLILHVISDYETVPSFLSNHAFFVGYDIGVCEEEKTVYSSIFNEILFGHTVELIEFHKSLNQNFLFPDKSLAEKYVNVHNELSVQGKDVEDYEEMVIYGIWKQKG